MTTLLLMFLFVFGPSRKPVLTDHSKNCPVLVTRIDVYNGATGGILAPNMAFDYKNVSDKQLMAIKVGPVVAYNAFGKPSQPLFTIIDTHLNPGKKFYGWVREEWWYTDPSGAENGADVSLSAVAFQDGSTWTADADHVCKASLRYVTK